LTICCSSPFFYARNIISNLTSYKQAHAVVVVGMELVIVVVKVTAGPSPPILDVKRTHPPHDTETVLVEVKPYTVFVGPTTIGSALKTVFVHGVEATSFFAREPVSAVTY
jgi:hypothetical protein